MSINLNPNIAIVGGGPSGLLAALLAKDTYPAANIVILERNEKSERDNPLNIERNSFAGAPQTERIKALLKRLFPTKKSYTNLDTNKIEDNYLQDVKELGITLLRGSEYKVENTADIKKKFPNVKLIVGADGRHSKVRDQVFGDLAEDQALQYIAMVKYETDQQNPKQMSYVVQSSMMKMVDASVVESPKKEGKMNLLFGIDSHTYQSLKTATFKNPFKLDQCSKSFQQKVTDWLKARGDEGQRPKETLKVFSIKLDVYSSQDFVVKDEDGVYTVLLGDSAFGVPYFRSLNNGIISAIKLNKAIGTLLNSPNQAEVDKAFKKYNRDVRSLARWEIAKAKVKAFAIKVFSLYIKCTGFLPRKLREWYENYFLKVAHSMNDWGTSKSMLFQDSDVFAILP